MNSVKKLLIVSVFLAVASLVGCDRSTNETAPNGESVSAAQAAPEVNGEAGDPQEPRLILVTGATGTQGGAVARVLLKRGFAVRGLTRNPDSSKARALNELGAEMVQGDFDDAESITLAMMGVDGVFAVTLFWSAGYEGEVNQGKLLIDTAVEAGVGHFVLTSVAGADQATGIPHFDSKWEVEQYLHESDLNWTVIRPVEFMDNWNWSAEQFREGKLIDPRASDSSHQWIAADDIGFVVAEAFAHPDQWVGVTQEIAGDELTVGELAGVLTESYGHDVVHQQISWEQFESESGAEISLMVGWFEEEGYAVDVTAMRARYPELITARAFIQDLAGDVGQ